MIDVYWPIIRFGLRMRGRVARVLGLRTVGVRVMVFNDAGQILLVRHTYRPGWHFPGGAVDNDETPAVAAIRECREETGATDFGTPKLINTFHHRHNNADDIVLLYEVTARAAAPYSDIEIAETRWFSLENLPDDLSKATRQRFEERRGERSVDGKWSIEVEK